MPIKIQPNWEFIEMLLGVVWWVEFYVKIWCDNLLLNDVKYEFYILSLLNSNSSQRPLIHRHVCMEYYVHSVFFFKTQPLIKTQHIFIGWWREPAPTQICYTLNLPLILSLPLPLPLPPSLSLSLSLSLTHTHTHINTHTFVIIFNNIADYSIGLNLCFSPSSDKEGFHANMFLFDLSPTFSSS